MTNNKTLNETYKEVITEKYETIVNEFYEIKDDITIYKIAIAIRQESYNDPMRDEDEANGTNSDTIKAAIKRGLETSPMKIRPNDIKIKILDVDGYDGKWEHMGDE